MTDPLCVRLHDLLTRFILTFETIGETFFKLKSDGILSPEAFNYEGVLEFFCESFDSDIAFIGRIEQDKLIKVENIYKSTKKEYESIIRNGKFPLTSVINNALESKSFLSWDSESVVINQKDHEAMNNLGIYTYSVCPFSEMNKVKVLIICNRKSRIDNLVYYDSYEGKLCKIILELIGNVKINEKILKLQNDYETAKKITGSRTHLLKTTKELITESVKYFPDKILPEDELVADYLDSKLSLLLSPTNMSKYETKFTLEDIKAECQVWFEKWQSLPDKEKRSYQLTALSFLKVFYALKAKESGNEYTNKIKELHYFLEEE
jgi:hypothetical protein